MKEIKLNEQEIEIVKEYQRLIERERLFLGLLREKYLIAESNVMSKISKCESDLISNLKSLAKLRDISLDKDEWSFDPQKYIFQKVQ